MQMQFNPAQYDFYTGGDVLADGDYPVFIKEDIAERTKDGTGGLLKVTYVVMDQHPNAKRQLFNRFNLWNQSPQSAEIAHKQYKTMLAAMGIFSEISDTQMTYNKPLIVTVKSDGTYSNVTGFKTINGVTPGKEGQAGPMQTQQPQQQQPMFAQPTQTVPTGFPAPGQPQQGFTPPQQQGVPPQQQFSQPQFNQPAPQGQPGQPSWGAPAPGQMNAAPQFGPPQGQQQQQFTQPQFTQPQNPAQGFQQQPPQGAPVGWPQQ